MSYYNFFLIVEEFNSTKILCDNNQNLISDCMLSRKSNIDSKGINNMTPKEEVLKKLFCVGIRKFSNQHN